MISQPLGFILYASKSSSAHFCSKGVSHSESRCFPYIHPYDGFFGLLIQQSCSCTCSFSEKLHIQFSVGICEHEWSEGDDSGGQKNKQDQMASRNIVLKRAAEIIQEFLEPRMPLVCQVRAQDGALAWGTGSLLLDRPGWL